MPHIQFSDFVKGKTSFKHANSCAIVGNSGHMLDHRFGQEIDAHDCVVRFNAAPIQGFEEHVGSKSTLQKYVADN